MEAGDHLVSPRTGYTHHGLYIGNNQVIHYSGFVDGFSSGEIEITSLNDFGNGNEVTVKDHSLRKYDHEESVERAWSRLGEDWYNVLINNCEHFVTWCITGFHSSSQVNKLIVAIAQQYGKQIIFSTAERELGRRVTGLAVSSTAKFATSTLAGTAAGATAGIVAASSLSTGAATSVVSGLAAGAAGVAAAPVAIGVAVGLGVAYGIKKAWDFFTD